jgi:tetratricopeptide (TPR) repeat protein
LPSPLTLPLDFPKENGNGTSEWIYVTVSSTAITASNRRTNIPLKKAFVNPSHRLTRPYFERALAIREQVLGPEHPDTASSLTNLDALLRAQGDLAAARSYYERALQIFRLRLGQDHAYTQTVLTNPKALETNK